MNSSTIAVSSVNNSVIVPTPLNIAIAPAHVSDPTWDRKRLVLARIASGTDKKLAVAEYNVALATHRGSMKAQVAAILSTADAVVTRIRTLKSGAMNVSVENHASRRIAAETKITARIEKLQAALSAVRGK